VTLERTRLAPGRGLADERVAPAAVLAVVLAVVGVVVTVWRPLAPPLGSVVTDLTRFAPEVLETVREYREPRYAAGVLRLALSLAVPLLVAWTPTGRRFVRWLAGHRTPAAWRGGLVAAAVTALTATARLPFDVWMGFVHEGRWGFRTAPLGLWGRDWIIQAALGAAAAGVAATVLLWAVARWPRSWHWRLVTIGTVLAAVVVMAFPLVVEPLFTRKAPLPDGPTRDRVEQVLAAAGEAGLGIAVADASTRTTKVNAYVSGLGPTRQVVLFDTLLELPPDQVGVIVAHELSHRLHRDLARGIMLAATALLVALIPLRWLLTSPGAAALAEARHPADPRLVAVAMVFAALATLVGQPVGNLVSRRAEAAADFRAVELTGAAGEMVRTSRTFVVRDLAQPDPPAWVRLLWATHPTADERIRAAVLAARGTGAPLPAVEELQATEAALRHPAIPRVVG
jgi:STE24 endopeptidase